MRTVLVELEGEPPASTEALAALEALGARRIEGYEPVPMAPEELGDPMTTLFTLQVPPSLDILELERVCGVVRVYGDVPVSPLS